ncbi:MAG: isoprenylcysteine carboxylmethyltransferase family protein [Alphaproteobacteria bacterium]|nr:isoprenylcysteine carboxylmethyltransferase family protein [Alphaproteobacteria bacterium]
MTPLALLVVLALSLVIGFPMIRAKLRYGHNAFEAPQDPVQSFLHGAVKLTLGGYLLWGAALVAWGPEALDIHRGPLALELLGYAACLAGLGLTMLAQWQMGRSWRIGMNTSPTALVTQGLYRVTRNPIYLGLLMMVGGVALAAPSGWTALGYGLCHVLFGFQCRAEEGHLLTQHGEDYRAWASEVGRLLPGLGRL